jgi:tetratricopeptide (TPR) repeat protein
MIEQSLVYIYSTKPARRFVGCGTLVHGGYVATCRHLLRMAVGQGQSTEGRLDLEIEFPHAYRGDLTLKVGATLVDSCESVRGPPLDLVLLLPEQIPSEAMALQLAREDKYETGEGFALIGLAGRDKSNPDVPQDVRIDGKIADYRKPNGLRQFTGISDVAYWSGRGSSGSPVFREGGQQLAGILCKSELGANEGQSPLREALVVPATAICPFVDGLIATRNAFLDKLLAELDARGEISKAKSGGLEREIVVKLAKQLKPDETLDFDQAVAALENAVGIALDSIARGRRGTNEDDFVNALLERVADQTKAGQFDQATQEVDAALVELDRREIERREALQRSRIALLKAGIEQDILRRDALAVARRVARIAATEEPDDSSQRFEALRKRQAIFHVEGRDKGLNFSLEIAIEIARSTVNCAQDADQRGAALNDLGVSLATLGERESGTARLEQAVAAFRDALNETTRERVPLDWAMTQNNLGAALATLGERESGTARLKEAVAAYRDALKERTRERVPLNWATTQNNLGAALATLGERESGTARLDEAVAAYRDALKERTRERVPLDWAMTQNNLGNALRTLGERESGTAWLDEAVAAYRAAIEVFEPSGASHYLETAQRNLARAEAEIASHQSNGPD